MKSGQPRVEIEQAEDETDRFSHNALESAEASSLRGSRLLLILVFFLPDILGATCYLLVLTLHDGETVLTTAIVPHFRLRIDLVLLVFAIAAFCVNRIATLAT
jgi:hypothetical protein